MAHGCDGRNDLRVWNIRDVNKAMISSALVVGLRIVDESDGMEIKRGK